MGANIANISEASNPSLQRTAGETAPFSHTLGARSR